MSLLRPLLLLLLLSLSLPAAAQPDFAHQVAPILSKRCMECHSDTKKRGGLSLNTEASFRAGSENGPIVDPANPAHSLILELIATDDEDTRMPPKGKPLSAEEVAIITEWVKAGAPWEPGFAFVKPAYDPPLKPRRPELPAAREGRGHPLDRILDHYLAEQNLPLPEPLDDATFLRRIHLDLTGLLPEPAALQAFLADSRPDKRQRKIDALLADQEAYTEHWLSFWNDLLRNDYAGTGYIDGGRKQITAWLYQSLYENKPYDQFVRELVAPSPETEGFANGIQWRGSVSAAQTVPLQYSQSVGQTFLGLNLKCASCHDSFVDRWKLSEAYGLAAIYSDTPLEMYRCDKPTGRTAKPGWLFPELGEIDASQPKAERLRQLAALITHPENGRTTRAIVNRLWHRLMGRGIVHPVDAMQSEPWNADLLDYLAVDLSDHRYDLKQTLRLICSSQAYQSRSESFDAAPDETRYRYRGPRPKRLSAEEFTDAIWQICGTAPRKFDAPVKRPTSAGPRLAGQAAWIWSDPQPAAVGAQLVFRKRFELPAAPERAAIALTADNEFDLFINGRKAASGTEWQKPVAIPATSLFRAGVNEILLVVRNGGSGPNLAAAVFHAFAEHGGRVTEVVSDPSWEWSAKVPDGDGRFRGGIPRWQPGVAMNAATWGGLERQFPELLAQEVAPQAMVRASLLKSDLLMRTLGRPNREQIVSARPNDLTTLEAMDLNNGAILDRRLAEGAEALQRRGFESTDALISYVWRAALSREPQPAERELAQTLLGSRPTPQAVQDFLWSVIMLPEFQIIR